MKYYTLFFLTLGKMLQDLSSAAVVIGALRVKKPKKASMWKLMTVDFQERSTWRSGVSSATSPAYQLPRTGPTDVDDAPAPA